VVFHKHIHIHQEWCEEPNHFCMLAAKSIGKSACTKCAPFAWIEARCCRKSSRDIARQIYIYIYIYIYTYIHIYRERKKCFGKELCVYIYIYIHAFILLLSQSQLLLNDIFNYSVSCDPVSTCVNNMLTQCATIRQLVITYVFNMFRS